MNERVAIEEERLPFLAPRGRHAHGEDPVEELQHHALVLLQQLVRELGRDFEERQVGRRSRGVVRVLERCRGEEDGVAMESGDRLAVLERVQAEREGEALRQFLERVKEFACANSSPTERQRAYLDGEELVRLAVHSRARVALQISEQHREAHHHCPRAAHFVDLPRLSQSCFDDVPVVVVVLDVMAENVRGGPNGQHVVNNELAVARQEVAPLVQLLDLRVLVVPVLLVVHEHVRLDEVVERLLQAEVGLVHERPEQRVLFQLLAERNQQVANC